ncbi:thiamine pyrophosphate-dependent enzyme [Mycoplasma sp. Mirounga ES2805-ORL]|uniref:thiamine pyrophosphate-dependent enzyme n=1 Tax=Mycoplasma sp. Mirounga ES2805-ORL TaxID=754514 RepID=UPI00197B9AFF|nr:thiamine pyrophosphate-dependent enzyme [Mycoplasma sp. Mirounga ES2805-ORL]QSF13740.1 pyruvate dehydrogenase [Mycoplasma sp. Mirounga ES2805-ORL]
MTLKHIEKGLVMSKKEDIIRYLDVDGNLISGMKSSASKEELLDLYNIMVKSRQWDNYALTLQKTGRLGTFAPNLGEEAFLAAIGYTLEKDDWFIPHYRVLASLIARGVTYEQVFLYWRGSEKGASLKGLNTIPMQVIIGSQCSQAAGVAMALKAAGKNQIAVTTIGNGGTNEGEFHEALNLASVRKLPVVFAISNNKWAISVPEHNSYAVETLAARAASYGIPGIRVDGNDLLASFEVLKEAYEFARKGNGPILLEFDTWRQGQHTTSDDPRVYRSEAEEKEHEKWEPFHRIEKYLLDNNLITQDKINELKEAAEAAAKKAYEKSTKLLEKEGYDDIFKYTYKTLPEELKAQQEKFRKYLK